MTRREAIRWAILAAVIFGFPQIVAGDAYYVGIEIMVLIWAIAGLAWNLIGGYQNQFALGHSVFFAIGAYGVILLKLHLGWSPWVGVWVAVALASAVSALVAWLCLRLKGAFYALATFALSQVVFIIVSIWDSLTNGNQGIALNYEPGLGRLIFSSATSYVYAFGLIVLAIVALTYWFEKTRWGLASRGISQDEDAAAALGVHTLRTKVFGATLSGGLTAIAGMCYAQYLLFVDPQDTAGIDFSIQVSLIVVFGGAATAIGPVIGAALLIPISSILQSTLGTGSHAETAPGLTTLVYGAVLTVTLLYIPDGVGPRTVRIVQSLWDFMGTHVRRRSRDVGADVADDSHMAGASAGGRNSNE